VESDEFQMRPNRAPVETVVPAGVELPDEVDPESMLDLLHPDTRRMATQVALPSLAPRRPRERSFMGMNRPLSFTPETRGSIQEENCNKRMAEL
jgi:hypothetical protein